MSTAALLVGVGFASAQGMREGTSGGASGAASGAAGAHMSQGSAGAESGGHAQSSSRAEGAAREHAQAPSRSEGAAQRSEGSHRSTVGEGSREQAPNRAERSSENRGAANSAEHRANEGRKQGEARSSKSSSTQRGEAEQQKQHGQAEQQKRSTTGQAPNAESNRRNEAQHQNQDRGEAQRQNQKRTTTGQAPSNAQQSQRGQAERNQNRTTTGQAPSSTQPTTERSTQQPSANQPANAQQPSSQRQGQTAAPAENRTGAASERTTDGTFRSASGRVTLDSQRETRIRDTVLSRRDVPRAERLDFALSIGVDVPRHVHIAPITRYSELVEVFPQYRDDEFFVADDDIVVVDHSHRVVDVVPTGPRSHVAHASSGSGQAVALDLSREEIIEVQQVLIDQGFLVGQPTGVLDVRTNDAIVAFQRQKGIRVTGSIDTQTVSSLGLSGRIGQGTTGAGTTSVQGSAGARQPGNNNVGGEQMPNRATNGQGQASPRQPAQPSMGNQGANQPNAQTPQQNRSTTGQAPSGGMQQQAPAQNQPMQNQPTSGQGNAQPAMPAPQNQNRPNR